MKRFMVGLFGTVFVLVGLAVGIFFGVGYYLSPQDPLARSDAVVAISGGETDARTAEAVQLYKDGWGKHIIFSGAALDTSGPSNARAMAGIAEQQGVPATDILLDETAANTRQNASGVAQIVAHENFASIILVTSPYHQRRASIAFHRAFGTGVSIHNHSSYDRAWRRSNWWASAQSRAITYSELQKVAYELVSGSQQ